MSTYRGRFAPSPTGALHAGSMVAALASWLDARAHQGRWLVRIEDVDTPRCESGAEQRILQQLTDCGLSPDEPPLRQSQRGALYQQALDRLITQGKAYPCRCSRKDIEAVWLQRGVQKSRHQALAYPGTCRDSPPPAHAACDHEHPLAWRFRVPATLLHWEDRRLGPQQQCVDEQVGDFILKRADGLWSYQLAVVVDDADQGITHVVRGEDLADNTPRQCLLQDALGLPRPQYLHSPLVLNALGEKLSKQNQAPAVDTRQPLTALREAAQVLQLSTSASTVSDALQGWTQEWAARWCPLAQ
jgi:glutamyl-Q tRNA(Asp) synthetase